MAFAVVGLVIATILFLVYLRKSRKNGKIQEQGLKEIPGPKGLPIIGNVLQLGRFPNDQYCKWSKEFGDIYQVNLAGQKVIVVSNPKLAKEIFSEHIFTGRPHFTEFDLFPNDPGLGIFNSDGEHWEVHRRFLLRQLRDFGFGKSAMEQLIMDEVNEVISKYKEMHSKPVTDIQKRLRLALVNGLWTILTSKRFAHDDPKLMKVTMNTTESFNELFEKGMILVFMPWLRHIIPNLSGWTPLRNMLDENANLFYNEVVEHKANFKEEDLKDFIDVYLAEVRKTKDPQSPFYGIRAEHHLAYTLHDLFLAGTESTAATISWTILYLCKFPEVQRKLQKELDQVTGKSRNVSVSDRPEMPYALALLEEVFRFSSIAADGVQHRAMADKIFQGYFIPKDAWIQPNTYYMHMDPELWKNPEKFQPERFLSSDGTKFVKSENMQAFQAGRRACAGETLARDSVFLYVTNFFLHFDMEFAPGKEIPGLESRGGFLRNSKPYWVIMKPRM